MTTFTEAWDAAYNGLPSDTGKISLGPSRIRSIKTAVQEREKVDHSWVGDANDGKHNQVTTRPQTADPTLDTGDGALYAKVVSGTLEIFYQDSAGAITQLTSGGRVNPAGLALINGSSSQAFNVANATSSTEAVSLGQAQADFAALAGLSTQVFAVAASSAIDAALNRSQFGLAGTLPGHLYIPTNGGGSFLIQWGVDGAFFDIVGTPARGVTFPIAYSAFAHVIGIVESSTTDVSVICIVSNMSNTGFTAGWAEIWNNVQSARLRWLAIGY